MLKLVSVCDIQQLLKSKHDTNIITFLFLFKVVDLIAEFLLVSEV